jgi:glycosyltransferase involved in cell wall biosynthesis
MPQLSVVLPVYNNASLVGRAISSVLGQTWTDWELIVVDDGSSDGSGAMANVYARHDPRIQVLSESHRGRRAARDRGIAASQGEIVTFLDSHDYYQSVHLGHQLLRFEISPELMMLTGTPTVLGNPYIPDVLRPGQIIPIQECVIQGTFFVRRNIFKEVGKLPIMPEGEALFFYERVRELGLPLSKVLMPTYIHDRTRKP